MLTAPHLHRLSIRNRPLLAALPLAFLCGSVPTPGCRAQIVNSPSQSASTPPLHAAQIAYSGGLLTVTAENASLNQVVRDIARKMGMKVTGRVADDRVFGTYGPEPPSVLLSKLLDGSGSNLLIVQDASHLPTELILTPRTGGATPPNPNAQYASENEAEPTPAQAYTPPPQPSPNASNSRSPGRLGTGGVDVNPAATSPSSTSQQVVFPPVDASTPPATATTTPTTPDASPATAKTPQQIFEQLQKLRQQQSQQPQTQP